MTDKYILVKDIGHIVIKDFVSVEEAFKDIGVRLNDDRCIFETNIPNTGILGKNQNIEGLKENKLGIKGDFVIMGINNIRTTQGHLKQSVFGCLPIEYIYGVSEIEIISADLITYGKKREGVDI